MKHEEYALGKVQVSDAGGCSWRVIAGDFWIKNNKENEERRSWD